MLNYINSVGPILPIMLPVIIQSRVEGKKGFNFLAVGNSM